MATSAEYGLGEYPFPRGWFAIASAGEIGRDVKTLHYFGQDLVIYRGESGKVVLLDAYCPHMGTHLGMSTQSATVKSEAFLEGDCIRCPFHAWRFGADGVCDEIPYNDGPIPPKARIKSWPVKEQWGIIFCWHDPENSPPDFDLPFLPEWDDPEFVRWEELQHVDDLKHPIEVFDNMSDAPHLQYLHGAGSVVAYENEVEGYRYHQRETMIAGEADSQEASVVGARHEGNDSASIMMTTVGAYHGPGLMLARFREIGGVQLVCATPVEDGESRLWSVAMMRTMTGQIDDQAKEIRANYANALLGGLREDGEVWKHKRPATRIMQVPCDGPFRKARAWYSQFYNPRHKTTEILAGVTGIHAVRGITRWSDSEYAKVTEG